MNREAAQFFSTAWQAVHAAGHIVRQNWQRPMSIGHKGAIDLVTSVDQAAERCIVERLRGDFPNHSLLAEEETDYQAVKKAIDGSSIRLTARPTSLMATRSFRFPLKSAIDSRRGQ
jgi:fructose-1,6-bisphosphatase/inositol monophosphatase family enzyme